MHFSNFEDIKLQADDQIFFTDLRGHGFHGIYMGNYNQVSFNFLNFNGSKIEIVSLKDIQNLQKNC